MTDPVPLNSYIIEERKFLIPYWRCPNPAEKIINDMMTLHGSYPSTYRPILSFENLFKSTPKGIDMIHEDISQVLRLELEEQRREREIERRRMMLAEYLEHPPNEQGMVYMFERVFKGSDTVFRYVALLADNDRWYLTGGGSRTPQGVSWEDLALWLVSGDYPVTFSELDRLVPES